MTSIVSRTEYIPIGGDERPSTRVVGGVCISRCHNWRILTPDVRVFVDKKINSVGPRAMQAWFERVEGNGVYVLGVFFRDIDFKEYEKKMNAYPTTYKTADGSSVDVVYGNYDELRGSPAWTRLDVDCVTTSM